MCRELITVQDLLDFLKEVSPETRVTNLYGEVLVVEDVDGELEFA